MPRKLVLCIDDRSTSADVRKLLLECEGYRVLMASNGKRGLRFFATRIVDLVVLDSDLPDLNAVAIAREMHEIKPQVPIIMLSRYTIPHSRVKRIADAYITKGEHPAVLLDCVNDLLRQT